MYLIEFHLKMTVYYLILDLFFHLPLLCREVLKNRLKQNALSDILFKIDFHKQGLLNILYNAFK